MNTFKENTNIFLKKVVENHLKDNMKDYVDRNHLDRYFGNKPQFARWEEMLYDVVESIEYQIEVDKEQNEKDIEYPYDIKIIKSSIDDEKHTIKLLIINMKNEYILHIVLTIIPTNNFKNEFSKGPFAPPKISMNVSITLEEGFIIYK